MSKIPKHLRTGSDAGRGFRYQDAVAAYLAIQLWEQDATGTIIPEGGDDIEKRVGDTRYFISVKSRRHTRGLFRPSDIRDHLVQLNRRSRDDDTASLDFILEQDVTEDARLLAGKVAMTILPSPRDDAVTMVAGRFGCLPVAAEIAVASLQDKLGNLADENGPLPVLERRGFGAAEIDLILSDAVSFVDQTALEEAVATGLIEAVDFKTKRDEPSFYCGVDVEPGHIAAGLVVSQPDDCRAVEDALSARGRAIVCGPSGAGKSAVMWQVAHATRHAIRWYRLHRLSVDDLESLKRFMLGLRISQISPVGFVLDDAGRRLPEAWGEMLDIAKRIPGLVLLASCREEDLARLRTSDTPLLRPNATEELAKAIWDKLRAEGRTAWAGWREPWESSGGLLMEYAHNLSTDTRLRDVLREQFLVRLADPSRDLESDALRIVSCAHAAGAQIDVMRLANFLKVEPAILARAFARLAREHLVRAQEDGLVGPLHQLRSTIILQEAHVDGAVAMGDTLASAVQCVHTNDLSTLLSDIDLNQPHLIKSAIASVASRIDVARDPLLLAQALRGLAFLEAKNIADQWLATEIAGALSIGQKPVAAMLGLSGASLAGSVFPEVFVAAADSFGSQVTTSVTGLRAKLLDICKHDLVGQVLREAPNDAAHAVLAALIGLVPLPEQVSASVLDYRPDVTGMSLEDLVRLLEALIELDRDLAVEWVARVAPNGLLSRIVTEIPWTSVPRVEQDGDILVVSSSLVHIADDIVADTHEAVVALCRHLLALAPRADRADVDVVDARGTRLAIGDLDIAAKRLMRSAMPPKSRTDWNRTLVNAISSSSAFETRTAFLASATRIAADLVPTLERVLDRVIRGKQPSERDLASFGRCHEAARDMTSPIGPFADRQKGEADAYAELQDVLFLASADLVRRFAGLPVGANALAAHCGEKAKKLREAIADPMWSLLPEASLDPLKKIATVLDNVRVVAWDHGQRSARLRDPRPQVAKAGPRNALRTASRMAIHSLDLLSEELLQDLDRVMRAEGLPASILLGPVAPENVPGAASSVIVMVEVESMEDILVAGPVVFDILRDHVPQFTELNVVPLHADGPLMRFGFGGFETGMPMMEGPATARAEGILQACDIAAAKLPLVDLASETLGTAVAIGNFNVSKRGSENHPAIEQQTLTALKLKLEAQHARLSEALGDVSLLIEPAVNEALSSGVGTAELQSLMSGGDALENVAQDRAALVLGALSIDLSLELPS